MRNCCNFPSKNLHKHVIPWLILLPKIKSKRRAHLLIRRLKLFFFISISSSFSVRFLTLAFIHRWNQLAKFSLYSGMSDHPHKQKICRKQLLQIESQIVNQGLSASPVHQSLNSAQKKCSKFRTRPCKFIQQWLLKADELFLKTKRQVAIYKQIVSLLIFRTRHGHVEHRTMAILSTGAVKPKPFNSFYPTKRLPFGSENFV